MNVELSIIVPVYNQEECLSFCLDSVIYHNLQNIKYEIIIINDGSSDGSRKVAEDYQRKHEYIRLLNQLNRGVSVARNEGIKNALGTYVYFLDPDDYLLPGALDLVLFYSKKISTDILTFDTLRTTKRNLDQQISPDFANYRPIVQNGIAYIADKPFRAESWWYIINRQFLLESRIFFPEGRWLQDTYFTTKLFMHAKRVAHIPLDGHRYVVHSKSTLGTKEPKKYYELIKDYEWAIMNYNQFIKQLSLQNDSAMAIQRLQNKQGSIVLFLIIRCIKSELNYNEICAIVDRLEIAKCYPIKHLLGKDYNGVIYLILLNIINRKILLRISLVLYRLIGKYFVK